MLRIRSLALAMLVTATASAAHAQNGEYRRGEITPFGAYQWGGTFHTNGTGADAGELHESDGFSWGVILSFLAQRHSAAELTYTRQETNVTFDPSLSGSKRDVGKMSNNYIQLGVRQDVPKEGPFRPFITASMGVNVLDAQDAGSSTRFAWSLGGGGIFIKPESRVGLRIDVRWMVTPVPSGTYGTWCSVWGCTAVSGTTWLHQGQAGGGLVIAF